jgi:hypothetical protein
MVFVLWAPVLWSAWSSFFGGFVCCLGGFPGTFWGVSCVWFCPGAPWVCVSSVVAYGLKCVPKFRALNVFFGFFVVSWFCVFVCFIGFWECFSVLCVVLFWGFGCLGGVWGLRFEMCAKNSDFKCVFYFFFGFLGFCVLCVSKAFEGVFLVLFFGLRGLLWSVGLLVRNVWR